MTLTKADYAYKLTDRELQYLSEQPEYHRARSLPEAWEMERSHFSRIVALKDPHSQPAVELTYAQLGDRVEQFAAGIQSLGLPPIENGLPPRIALFANNSPRWQIADRGLMYAGAADVVRGSDADIEELVYIFQQSGSVGLVVENRDLYDRLDPHLESERLKWVILLSDEEAPRREGVQGLNFSEVLAKGGDRPLERVPLDRDTLATLLYTSGTTGKPKGVMLTHGNLLHQLSTIGAVLQAHPGDRTLSLLPTWHSFGRIGEYFFLSRGCTQIYTSIRHVKIDFKQYKPKYTIGVPRLWESIYEAIQKQLSQQPENKQKLAKTLMGISQQYIEARRTWQGLRLELEPPGGGDRLMAGVKLALLWPVHAIASKLVYAKIREATGGQLAYVISGGGSLAMHLENFFEAIGLDILVGYGLTETSPVLTARRFWHNLRGSAGRPIPETAIRIVDPETRRTLKPGERGLVLARGPQIMQGYYQNPEATATAIDGDGWFDTGDLGWLNTQGDLILTGRAKETIVLTNGENIEPQPIEDACLRSAYIDQIVLVGQDRKYLGALVVPNFEALEGWASRENVRLYLPETGTGEMASERAAEGEIALNSDVVHRLFRQELNREVKNRPSYRSDDRIGTFWLLDEPFSIENGMMTQTLKIKKPVVVERYRSAIEAMYN